MTTPITLTTRILRKQADLPRYVVISPEHLPDRDAAFPADVTLNGTGPFPRNIRPWGKGSEVFFFNLTAAQCAKAGVETNDLCKITIMPQD